MSVEKARAYVERCKEEDVTGKYRDVGWSDNDLRDAFLAGASAQEATPNEDDPRGNCSVCGDPVLHGSRHSLCGMREDQMADSRRIWKETMVEALATPAPVAADTLTDEQIWDIWREGQDAPADHPVHTMEFDLWFARAILAATPVRVIPAQEQAK